MTDSSAVQSLVGPGVVVGRADTITGEVALCIGLGLVACLGGDSRELESAADVRGRGLDCGRDCSCWSLRLWCNPDTAPAACRPTLLLPADPLRASDAAIAAVATV